MSSLAARLSRLDREINEKDSKEIEDLAGGTLKEIINKLIDAIDPDRRIEKAKEIFNTDNFSDEQIKIATESLIDEACRPFDNPDLREILITIKKRNEQIIDTISKDRVIGP